MNKGINKSLYIKSNVVKHHDELCRLAEEEGSSFSEVMNEAIRQAYYQKRTGVWISPGAYLAIANGQLNALECVRSRNGSIDLVLKMEAPSLAGEGPDHTYPGMKKLTAYSMGTGFLQHAAEPDAK